MCFPPSRLFVITLFLLRILNICNDAFDLCYYGPKARHREAFSHFTNYFLYAVFRYGVVTLANKWYFYYHQVSGDKLCPSIPADTIFCLNVVRCL